MNTKYMLKGVCLAATVLLGGGATIASAACVSGMSLDTNAPAGDPASAPVSCTVSNILNVGNGSDGVTWLGNQGLTNVTLIGKEDLDDGVIGTQAIAFTGAFATSYGSWDSNYASTTGQELWVGLKFDNVYVEFHNLGAVSTASRGFWETVTGTTGNGDSNTIGGCTLPDGIVDGCAGAYAALSNATYYSANDPNFTPGGAVPLPAAAWMFLSGIGLYGWVRRGKSSTNLPAA